MTIYHACVVGDSGGPLWKIFGSETPTAFLVGVVSRGLNCANNDAPGVYARVKMYLPWIYKNARSGECEKSRKVRNFKDVFCLRIFLSI